MGPRHPWDRAPWESLVHPLLGSCPEQMMGSKSRMQGKDVSEQETKGESSVGIDVCEAWLDVHILPAEQAFRVPNSYPGHRTLKRRLERYDLGLIVIEATGKWHRQLHRTLHAGGYEVRVVNPLRAPPVRREHGFARQDRSARCAHAGGVRGQAGECRPAAGAGTH